MKHYLAWTVMLAALQGATTKCNSCTVQLNALDKDATPAFLTPDMCCTEQDFPFTFLANFTTNQHYLTFYLHEYYLLDTKVQICERDFYEMYYDYYYPADDYTIERFCMDDFPFQCLPEKSHGVLDLSYRTLSVDGLLNITIPHKPRPVLQTYGPYAGRPIFNITFEWSKREPSRIIEGVNIPNLDMCSFNGYPVLIPDANRTTFWFECECVGVAHGVRCEWGEECQPHNLSTPCNGHGECRYYRGSIKCHCDEEHFGSKCEHHVSIGQPLQSSACVGMGLNCSHLCSLKGRPHCLCPPHLVLHNRTLCTPRAQLVDVTLQVLNTSHHHFPVDQVKQELKEACITVVNASYHNDSKDFQFSMNKYWRNCLPGKSHWEDIMNSTVSLSSPHQHFLWIGPLNKSVDDGRLVLQCTVYTSVLPVNVSFFIGRHQIYKHELNLCEGYLYDEIILLTLETVEDATNTIDNTCSSNAVCSNNTICTITLWADGYDPDLDWGKFSVEVSQGNTSTQQSVVVDADSRILLAVDPLSASLSKDGNTTLTCTLTGDWKWDEDCEFNWVVLPLDSGIFEVETPAWNVSYLYIEYLKQTITVTCEVSIWRFCDDRRNRTKARCVGLGCKPKVVTVHFLDQESLHCPEEMDLVPWHTTPVNYMSYSNCPKGFKGSSTRHCDLGYNETAVWSKPDYYHCVYRPFNDLLQRPVMQYLKRGYQVVVDYNGTVDEMRQLFEGRERKLLRGELSFIQDQFKYLLKPNVPPVDPQVFLGFIQEIIRKTTINDRMKLLPLVRTFLSLNTTQKINIQLGDLVLWKQDMPAEWEYRDPDHGSRLHLNVTLAQRGKERKAVQHVGTLVFLDPKNILAGTIYNIETSKKQVFGHELSGPAVEVVLPFSNAFSFISENIILNMSYYDPNGSTDRNVCGGARVSEKMSETIEWDLSRCSVVSQDQTDRGALRCQCQGQGLFAFITLPELVPTDNE